MDWCDKEDECNIFENENNFDIDNFFLKTHNSLVDDYETKLNDFILEKNEYLNSPKVVPQEMILHDSLSKENEAKIKNKKLFSVLKSKSQEKSLSMPISANKENMLSSHPFLVTGNSNPVNGSLNLSNNKASDSTNSISGTMNNGSTVSIEETSKSDSFECKLSKSSDKEIAICPDNDSLCNNLSCSDLKENLAYPGVQYPYYCVSLQNLPVSERMKIKKEKTKLLLERKTKRLNGITSLPDQFSSFYPGMEQQCNNIDPIAQTKYDILYMNSSAACMNMMNFPTQGGEASFTKKEIKMLRNRVSAQRSRDRKKREMDELKMITRNLFKENGLLRKELEIRDQHIHEIQEKLAKLCKNCEGIMNTASLFSKEAGTACNKHYSIVDFPKIHLPSSRLKYSLMTGLFVFVCLLGTLTFQFYENKPTRSIIPAAGRVLTSTPTINSLNDDKFFIGNDKGQKGMMPYHDSKKQPQPHHQPQSVKPSHPFHIVKDTKKKHKEEEFLEKKRRQFVTKMEQRKGNNGFLQKIMNNQCIQTDLVELSIIHEEDNIILEQQPEPAVKQNAREFHSESQSTAIIPKYSNDYYQRNQVVAMNFDEDSSMRQNIKSLYCRDVVTNLGKTTDMFNDLFKKLEMKNTEVHIEDINMDDDYELTAQPHLKINQSYKATSNEKVDEDCLYLHMILPQEEEKKNELDVEDINISKKVYYEVGCKIFEINKIYK